MIAEHLGETAALATAVCWTITSMSFEAAGKQVGSLPVNLIRLFIGLAFLSIFSYFQRGLWFPTDATEHAWIWLSLSAVAGFLIGDLFLFRAFVVIGSRLSMLLMSLVPPITALIGWALLGELLTVRDFVGMSMTVGGVIWVIIERIPDNDGQKIRPPLYGILFGVLGATGQAVGLVFSKNGMENYNPFAATQIRIIAGIIGFSILFTVIGRWSHVFRALKNRSAMGSITLGSIFGPFLGVSLSLVAIQYTQAAVAATIMAIVPILIIPPAIIIYHQKVSLRATLGAFVAVSGVAILFL